MCRTIKTKHSSESVKERHSLYSMMSLSTYSDNHTLPSRRLKCVHVHILRSVYPTSMTNPTPNNDEASKHASNKTASTMPHNDSVTTIKLSGSFSPCGSSHSSGGATSVPECIVHREKVAVAVSEGHNKNPAISSGLASAAAKKAFSLSIQVVDELGLPVERLGQGGLIQCPSLPTVNGTPPSAKRLKIMYVHGPTSAIKQSSSADHVC